MTIRTFAALLPICLLGACSAPSETTSPTTLSAGPGSMGPKIQAAIDFVTNSKNPNAWAAIGDLKDAADILEFKEGTVVANKVSCGSGVVWRQGREGPKRKESKDPPARA